MGKSVTEHLVQSQGSVQNHGKLVKSLVTVYKAAEFDKFWKDFIPLLKSCMLVLERKPAVERCLEFVAKFATSLKNNDREQGQAMGDETAPGEDDEDIHQFLLKLFDFCLQHSNANDKAVRFRACQLVNKLLSKMGDDAQIDDALYDRIYECLLQRLRDIFPIVRIQAVFALARLQDPTDEDCPIINGYLFLINCDSNCDVRRAVLTCIAASTKTLPALLDRTRDVKPAVRRLAYQILAEKVQIRALTIAQRITVLENGLHDREGSVRDCCTMSLLQAWLHTFQGNALDLLKHLDVESCIKTAKLMLTMLFKKTPAHELVSNFDLLNDQLVIPAENLSSENVVYWGVLCEHLTKLGDDGELLLEEVLPLPTAFAAYLSSVTTFMKAEEDPEEQMTNEFILHQLLELATTLDLSDEAGRWCQLSSILIIPTVLTRESYLVGTWIILQLYRGKLFGQFVPTLMVSDLTTHAVMGILVKCYEKYQRDPVARINKLCETIADIREPIAHIPVRHSADETRKMEIKIAQVRVKLNEMKEELGDSITQQEFNKAAEVKLEVERLEAEKRQLIEELEQLPTQEVRMEWSDSATLLKCMSIASSMLVSVDFCSFPASLQTLIQTLIMPGIQNDDPAVRDLAVKALGLCCLMKLDVATKYLILLITISQLDVDEVKVTALKVIFDLLLTFGLDKLGVSGMRAEDDETETGNDEQDSDQDEEDVENDEPSSTRSENDTPKAQSLIFILTELLNSEVSELRTTSAEGLAKLMLAGHIVTPKLFSRLLLLWYNPVTEDDTLLRHCLGTFFPIYAFANITKQAIVGEAILPTLRTLVNAPSSSPLIRVDINNVVDLLIQLTNARHLFLAKKENLESSCHDTLAVKLCNEILSELLKEDSCSVQYLCRALGNLRLTPSFFGLNDLAVLTNRILENLKDKVSRKTVRKFGTTLRVLLDSGTRTADDSQLEEGEMAEDEAQNAEGGDTPAELSTKSQAGRASPVCPTGERDSPVCLTSKLSPAEKSHSLTNTAPDTATDSATRATTDDVPESINSPSKITSSMLSVVRAPSDDPETISTPVSISNTSRLTLGPLQQNQTCKQSPKVEADTVFLDEADILTKTPTKITKMSKSTKRTRKDRVKSVVHPDISSRAFHQPTQAAHSRDTPSETSPPSCKTMSPLRKATRASSRRAARAKKMKRT